MYKIVNVFFLKLWLLFFILLSIDCNGYQKPIAKQTSATNAIVKLSNFFTDSAAITSFFKSSKATDSIKHQVYLFYKQRGYRFAWVSINGLNKAATNFYTQIHDDSKYFNDNKLISHLLDALITNANTSGSSSFTTAAKAQQIELLATTTFLNYAFKMYGGITNPTKNLEWHITRLPKDYLAFFNALSTSQNEIPQEPVSYQYSQLKMALLRYHLLQAKGGFPIVKNNQLAFSVGDTNACLVQVKQHLLLSGDMVINDTSDAFSNTLLAAVRHYQARMGLAITGKLTSTTIAYLNKPIQQYIRQILVNLERLRWLPATM